MVPSEQELSADPKRRSNKIEWEVPPVTDTADLIRAVMDNRQETTPLAMLADHLIEKGDGRGLILHKWLTDGSRRIDHSGFMSSTDPPPDRWVHNDPDVLWADGLTTEVRKGTPLSGGNPVLAVRFQNHLGGFSNSKAVVVPHAEAMDVADHLPNSEAVHQFLDTHFGPDPRFHTDLSNALKS